MKTEEKFSKSNVLATLQYCIDYTLSIQNALQTLQLQIAKSNEEYDLVKGLARFKVAKCFLKGINDMLNKNKGAKE